MRVLKVLLLLLASLALIWFAGRMIFAVPGTAGRAPEAAIPFDPATTLGPRAVEAQSEHPGESGVIPIADGVEALHSRIALADGAERSIDTMYYIWHQDTSGLLLLDSLRNAALRGVRVRLLLDDNGISGLDQTLAGLDALPNFDVRIFNPSTVRQPKGLGYVLYPLRMNRRMHNKAFIVDGAVAIVGGRNIGNEYFSVGDEPSYLDLDVLGVGTVVSDTATIFDEYWNSEPVLALDQVIAGPGDLTEFDAKVAEAKASAEGVAFMKSSQSAADRIAAGEAPQLEWSKVQVVADDPVKGTGFINRDQLMISRLGQILGGVKTDLDLISAYFVPGKTGTAFFTRLAGSGVKIRILTNSWEATDVAMVHAGYVKYRRELLEGGVQLYELKRNGDAPTGEAELGPIGSSGASLHAKTFSVDAARVFIGSFNFDPRSALLNCEMGFLIDSPTIAQRSSDGLTDFLVPRSYEPVLQDGDMVWLDPVSGAAPQVVASEPGLNFGDRLLVYVLNILPIEWLL
ncbi:phospholipase D family protein [Paracoccus pacificus]|uniref:Phospholipase D n=1 Tax=Paracoccus pacificus TaxID=1463598 RepID=A0ABW4R6G3_9RHOB